MAGTGAVLTYGELDDRSARLASALHGLGLRRGDVIAMLTDNTAEAFVIYWAALRSGLYVTAINRHLAAPEVAYILADSGAGVLFASAGLSQLAQDIAGPVHRYAFDVQIPGYDSYPDLLAGAGSRLADQPRGSDMLYSSGTTGSPKGIKPHLLDIQVDEPGDPLTALLAGVFGLGPTDVYLSPAPIYHAAPLKYCAAVQALGGTVVLMERFDAEAALGAIERYRVTITQMVPTMFVRMLQLADEIRDRYDHSTLRLAVHAGAPCPPDVKDAMIRWWGPILVEYYSATEALGTTIITSAEWLDKRGSVGRPVLGVVHICDDAGRELPTGEVGTVYFERDVVPFVYHNDPGKTADSRHPDHENWSTVGDLGYLDQDGYLFLTDRKSFMIISGGVNIYPQEIEDALTLHPDVFDVAVIGLPDDEYGESVTAVLKLRDGVVARPDLTDELISYLRTRIAGYKVPRRFEFVADLPRTPTGKLLKAKLRDQLVHVG